MSTHERPDMRAVYRAAWADREATGDTSDEVLLRQFRLHGVVMGSGAVEIALRLWRRGVTPGRLTWEIAKAGGRAARKVGRAYWELAKVVRGGFATPVPFEAALGDQELSDLLREAHHLEDGGEAGFEVWYDVRSVPAPTALVMFGDDVIGRSRIPDSEKADLLAAARGDQFATGSLAVHASGGLLLVSELLYDGLSADDDDDAGVDPA